MSAQSLRRRIKRGQMVYAVSHYVNGEPQFMVADRKACYLIETDASLENRVKVDGKDKEPVEYQDPTTYPQFEYRLRTI